MNLDDLRRLRPQIDEIAKRHGAVRIRVFGSVARGTADEKSDVDFLVMEYVDARRAREALDASQALCREIGAATRRGPRSPVSPMCRRRRAKEAGP